MRTSIKWIWLELAYAKERGTENERFPAGTNRILVVNVTLLLVDYGEDTYGEEIETPLPLDGSVKAYLHIRVTVALLPGRQDDSGLSSVLGME